ncbi:hypothetical protein [Endozoicomonas sp. Mp262]|uniref:hypothetical protein n=1 Tax=Endozoicomonas sp. Mp262 TaxID=2919499 RepID=UPI0021D99316
MAFNVDTCRSKDELEAQAKALFDVDLDKRKKLDVLKAEFRALIAGDSVEKEEVQEAAVAATHVKSKNGTVFPYHPLLKKRLGVDLTACDKDGNTA